MTIALKNDRLLRALRHEPVDVTPVWLMRQAGRYLPEYRALRKKAGSFMALCKNPEWAAEVTLQPLARFPLDAAILFSDILTIPDACGLGLHFIEGEGPVFQHPLKTAKEIRALRIPHPEEDLRYVLDAIRITQRELNGKAPLIGFCGSPWTVATYMLEGRADKTFPAIQKCLRTEPNLLNILLEKLAKAITLHLQAQINAGVQVVMIFDTWGGMLDTASYLTYSLSFIEKIIAELRNKTNTPIIVFTKSGGQWINEIAQSGCDAIGVDTLIHLKDARIATENKVALQGNFDPALLQQPETVIRTEVARILADYGKGSGHIFNLAHGVPQETPPEHVGILVDAVHALSAGYHKGELL